MFDKESKQNTEITEKQIRVNYKNPSEIYHEKQYRMMCSMHAINNLLQYQAVTKANLDEICMSLDERSWRNQHRNPLGLGNYDVNVLMKCFSQLGYDCIWYNKNTPVRNNLDWDSDEIGFIVNTASWRSIFGLPIPLKGAHWLAIKRLTINGKAQYYNLDSKLSKPCVIANDLMKFYDYIDELLKSSKDTHLFIISPKMPECLLEII